MSDETTLLPCPFCGSVDTLEVVKPDVKDATPDNYLVLCCWLDGGCGASSGTRRTEAEAIAAWNTRAATTIGQVAVEVVPAERTCHVNELDSLTQTLSMVNGCAWGECSECGCLTPDDSVYCVECGAKVVER